MKVWLGIAIGLWGNMVLAAPTPTPLDAYDRPSKEWLFHGPMQPGEVLTAYRGDRAHWAALPTAAPTWTPVTPIATFTTGPSATKTITPTATITPLPTLTPIGDYVADLYCLGAVSGCSQGVAAVITLVVPTPVLTATLAATATVQATATLQATGTLPPTATLVPTATLAPTATVQAYPTPPPTPINTISATVITITSSQAAGTESVVLCDSTSAAVVYTLPAVASSNQRVIRFKKIDTSKYKCTLDGNASETIDGSLTLDINTKNTSIDIVCNGSAWFIF